MEGLEEYINIDESLNIDLHILYTCMYTSEII